MICCQKLFKGLELWHNQRRQGLITATSSPRNGGNGGAAFSHPMAHGFCHQRNQTKRHEQEQLIRLGKRTESDSSARRGRKHHDLLHGSGAPKTFFPGAQSRAGRHITQMASLGRGGCVSKLKICGIKLIKYANMTACDEQLPDIKTFRELKARRGQETFGYSRTRCAILAFVTRGVCGLMARRLSGPGALSCPSPPRCEGCAVNLLKAPDNRRTYCCFWPRGQKSEAMKAFWLYAV